MQIHKQLHSAWTPLPFPAALGFHGGGTAGKWRLRTGENGENGLASRHSLHYSLDQVGKRFSGDDLDTHCPSISGFLSKDLSGFDPVEYIIIPIRDGETEPQIGGKRLAQGHTQSQ